jgi:thioesterase domain-containing protein
VPVVEITGGGSRLPLYCVHARSGNTRLYHDLARQLGPDQPVYGLEAPARNGGLEAYRRFGELAARYALELRSRQPQGPYHIVGECLGGSLAFELAAQLHDDGEDVRLVLIDAFSSGEPPLRSFVPPKAYTVLHRARILSFHLVNLIRLPTRTSYAREEATRAWSKVRRRRSQAETAAAFDATLAAYRPPHYHGRVILFRGARLPLGVACGDDLGWADIVEELEVVRIPGYFATAMSEPHVRVLAEKLRILLAYEGQSAPAGRLVRAETASTFGR